MMVRDHAEAFRLARVIDMHMNVDQPRRDIGPGDIHDLSGERRINVRRDPRNAIPRHRYVHHLVDIIRRVNHMTVLEQKIECCFHD